MKIGPFQLNRLIGQGAMADVWEANHQSGQQVAIKIVTSKYAHSQKVMQAFRNEARAAARLRHPNIIELLDMGLISEADSHASQGRFQASSPYLVMELASTFTLQDMVPCSSYEQLKGVANDVLAALNHAHANGVVHRDLKPRNVLLDQTSMTPRLKLSDFGISQAIFQRRDGSLKDERLQGTPYYMAPEQIKGLWREQGPWTDLYALGCMLYRLVTGKIIYQGNLQEVLQAHIHHPTPKLKPLFDIPARFESWLGTLLEKDTEKRCRLAADAAYALNRLELPYPVLMAPAPTYEPLMEDTLDEPAPSWHNEQRTLPKYHLNPPAPPIPSTWREAVHESSALRGVGLGLFGLKHTQTVARTYERDMLWQGLRRVHETKRAHLIVLRGDSGMGKTHLTKWLCKRAMETGAGVGIRINHHPDHNPCDGLPYAVAKLFHLLGLSTQLIQQKLTEWLHTRHLRGEACTHTARVLTQAISPWSETGESYPDEHYNQATQDQAFLTLLGLLAQERPLILHVDDLQWGNESIPFIGNLLDSAEPLPFLIVATVNPNAHSISAQYAATGQTLLQHPQTTRIDLLPMTAEAIERMVNSMIGLEPELMQDVIRRSQGQPLFTIQLLRDLTARDVLFEQELGYGLKQNIDLTLPEDVGQLWQVRIDQALRNLEPKARREAVTALQLAALLGGEFIFKTWRMAAYQCAIALSTQLVDLFADTGLIHLLGHTIRLSHGAMSQALQDMCRRDPERWRKLHHACAAAIGSSEHPWSINFDERMANHLLEAGQNDDALEHLVKAIQRHLTRGNLTKANWCIQQHQEVVHRLELPEDHKASTQSNLYRGIHAFEIGFHDDAHRRFERARQHARENQWWEILAQVELQYAALSYDQNELEASKQHLEEALDAATKGSARDLELQALTKMARLFLAQGQASDALAPLKIILRLCAEDDALTATRIMALIDMGDARDQLNMPEEAIQSIELALALSEQLGIRRLTAKALECRGEHYRNQGRLKRAIEDYERALELFEYADAQRVCVPIHLNLSFAHIENQDIQKAKKHLHMAQYISRQQNMLYTKSFIEMGLFICHMVEGHMQQCTTLLRSLHDELTTEPIQFPGDLKMLFVTAIAVAEELQLSTLQNDLEVLEARVLQR